MRIPIVSSAGPQGLKGDTGATGKTSATGDTGAQGPQGEPGSGGLSGMETITNNGDFGSAKSQTVTLACSSGKIVIGGGVRNGKNNGGPTSTEIEKIHLSSSFPLSTPQWRETIHSQDQSNIVK